MKNRRQTELLCCSTRRRKTFWVAKARNSQSCPLTQHYMSGFAHKIWLSESPPKGLSRQVIHRSAMTRIFPLPPTPWSQTSPRLPQERHNRRRDHVAEPEHCKLRRPTRNNALCRDRRHKVCFRSTILACCRPPTNRNSLSD